MYVVSQFLFALVVVICVCGLLWRICYEEGMDDPD